MIMLTGSSRSAASCDDSGSELFSSARSELPMLYAFAGLAGLEMIVMHLLAGLWSVVLAWSLSIASALLIGHFCVIAWRLRHRPTRAGHDLLVIRSGDVAQFDVPWQAISLVEHGGLGPMPSGREVFSTAIMAYPNVRLTLNRPIVRRRLGRERSISVVICRFDEPERFVGLAKERIRLCAADE